MIGAMIERSILDDAKRECDPTIFVVEDDEKCRKLTTEILSETGFAIRAFETGLEFLASITERDRGCVVLDHNLPGIVGSEILKTTRLRGLPIPFVIVSGVCTVPLAVDFMKLGAVTILEKPFDGDKLCEIVVEAVQNDCDRDSADALRNAFVCKMFRLTNREREILRCILSGMITKQIAKRLGISPKTVEVHRGSIVRKLEAESMLQIVQNLAKESNIPDQNPQKIAKGLGD
jgi:two-component system, LuxR family, response regulator FixJ